MKKILFAAVLALACIGAKAQEQETIEVFNPHWYLQGQVGGQYTLGEIPFGKLLSPNAQLGGGYNFNPIFGLRGTINAWQSKAGIDLQYPAPQQFKWKWYYVNPAIDATLDLTNLIGGYKYERPVTFGFLAGLGANIAFGNGQADDVNNQLLAQGRTPLTYLWDGSSLSLSARLGLYFDYKVSEKVSLGLEGQYNFVNDYFNSKQAYNPDGFVNVLVGVKFNLGPTHKTKVIKTCDPVVVEKIVEKPVEKIVEKVVPADPDPLKETVFFAINVTDSNNDEVIDKVVEWCKKYPSRGVSVRGYADKGTGTPAINKDYAKKRADKIAKKITTKLVQNGIDQGRISVSSYGDTVQPFDDNDLNRCVIIIGE